MEKDSIPSKRVDSSFLINTKEGEGRERMVYGKL